MVPPDEHWTIDRFGCTLRYRMFREAVRKYYRDHYPLLPEVRSNPRLNPGGGTVSRLCFEPRVGVDVLNQMFAPYLMRGRLEILMKHCPIAAETQSDRIQRVCFRDHESGDAVEVSAAYFLEASELGDLLPLAGVEYVTGAESLAETGEPHAPASANREDVQAITWCAALAYDPKCEPECDKYRIPKPGNYGKWRDFAPQLEPKWGGKLISWKHPHPTTHEMVERKLFSSQLANETGALWLYRRIVAGSHYPSNMEVHDVTVVNWPQNDYFCGNLIDKPKEEAARYLGEARELTLSLIYWLQNEAPRPDGGTGYAGLYLQPGVAGTNDGLAKAPYIREARRIRGLFTVTENHVGKEARGITICPPEIGDLAERFTDSIGVGYYNIDLHPSGAGRNYLDIASLPFRIPMGSLIPQRVSNLLAAGKSLSVTHLANGCYRLHPVEWNIGESAGALAAFCLARHSQPLAVHASKEMTTEFQNALMAQGVEIEWPCVP
ncbi:MAG: FAD-dependent oxidoreductase [Verrucomicrobia bacterium]|nr:FAD-dependent oxidoreductase [Verrucomicrobiota bacterium]